MKESDLRDQLKVNLNLIEEGLELVDDEFYLKNRIGTNGFVDILARDCKGRLVVIEIKISKHSERDAITELFKYIALLKQNMSLKDSEIRLIVISTDWRELLVPFTEFHKSTMYTTCGLIVQVDKNAFPTSIKEVELPSLSVGRKLIPRHWIQVYRNKPDRDSRSQEYGEKISERGIHNFVIAHFHFDYTGFRQYGFYFAQQEESLDLYKGILSSVSEERYEEINDYTSEFTDDEDVLNEFADAATDMICVPGDELETGHPEKIKGYLQNEMWVIDNVIRYGTFSSDIRLTDEQIIQDLCGFTGASYTWYAATVKQSDSAHIEEISERYSGCLYHNDSWRQAIRDYIDYFKSKDAGSTMHLSIFNPENILESLYLISKHEDLSYLPNFKLIIETPSTNEVEIFEGIITSSGNIQNTLEQIIDRHFDGDPSNIPMYAHLHAVSAINSELMADLSLSYSTRYKLFDAKNSDSWKEKPKVRGRKVNCANTTTKMLIDWIDENAITVDEICSIYESCTFNPLEHMS